MRAARSRAVRAVPMPSATWPRRPRIGAEPSPRAGQAKPAVARQLPAGQHQGGPGTPGPPASGGAERTDRRPSSCNPRVISAARALLPKRGVGESRPRWRATFEAHADRPRSTSSCIDRKRSTREQTYARRRCLCAAAAKTAAGKRPRLSAAKLGPEPQRDVACGARRR